MAKKTVATLGGKSSKFTKVIKMVKSSKSDSYVFVEKVLPSDNTKDWLAKD